VIINNKQNPKKNTKYGTYQTPLYKTLPPKKKAININTSSKASLYKNTETKKKKNEELSPENLLRGIKKIRNKGVLALGEHNRTNVVIDTDSEQSISNEENLYNKQIESSRKGTTKLLVSKMEQTQLNSTSKKLLNIKSQKRERLSNYIVKTDEKPVYNSPNVNLRNPNYNTSINREYNIKIPGSNSKNQKKDYNTNRYNYNYQERSPIHDIYKSNENDVVVAQNFVNMNTQKYPRQYRNSHQRNVEIFVSPDEKITANIRSPNTSYINSPSYYGNNSNNYYKDNFNNYNTNYNNYYNTNYNYNFNNTSQGSKNIYIQTTPSVDKQYIYNTIDNNNQGYTTTNNFLYSVSSIMDNEGSPISTYKPLNSSPRSPNLGGKVDLNINQFNDEMKRKYYAYYKERLPHIILLQRFIREHLNNVNYRVEKIQSYWRGYWLRKIIYVRLIMFYKGQALIEHFMNLHNKILKRNFKHLIYKLSFRPSKRIPYKFLSNQMDLISRIRSLNLGIVKKNHFEKESLKISQNSSFTYEGLLNELNENSRIKMNLVLEENERKFEKLYYDLLSKYEELKNSTKKFDEKLMKIDNKNILFDITSTKLFYDDEKNRKKFATQAFYLKESKINKFPNEKAQIRENEIEIDDEPLNEGEILFPEEKQTNNTISDIQQEDIEKNIPKKKSEKKERKIRLNKRINDENKSKEDEEIFKKEKEDKTTLHKRYKKLAKEKEDEEDESSSLSIDPIYKKIKVSKNEMEESLNNSRKHSNKKETRYHFDNLQIDYTFETINIIALSDSMIEKEKIDSFENEIESGNEEEEEKEFSTPKRDEDISDQEIKFIDEKEKIYFEEEFEIQKNIAFSVIDRDYTLEQLPVIEEEKEELLSIESKVNEFFIESCKIEDEKVFDMKDITLENISSNNFSVINGQILENNQMSIIKIKKVEDKRRVSKEKNKFKNIIPDSSFKTINILGSKEEESNIIENVPKVFDSLIIKQNKDFTFCISPVKSKETSEMKDIFESKDISEIEKSRISKEEKIEKKENYFVLEEVKNEINIEIIGIQEEKRFKEMIPSNDVVNNELIGENIEKVNKFKILKKEENVNELEGNEIIEKEDEESKIPSKINKIELISQKKEKDKKPREKLELISIVNELNIEATELGKEFENLTCEENISINFNGNDKENEFEIQKKNVSEIKTYKKEEIPEFKRVNIEKKKGKMEDKKSKEILEKKPLTTLEDIITKKEIEENIPETNYVIEHFDIINQGNIKPKIDLLTSSTNELEKLKREKEEPELEIITNINELIIEGKEKEEIELNKEDIDIIKEKEKLLKFTPHELEFQIIAKT